MPRIIIIIPILALAAAIPLGATVLGWMAVSEIRRSGGRFYGVGLAVFGGLVFPLVTLDSIIAALIYAFGYGFLDWTHTVDDGRVAKVFLIACVLSIVIDWLIVRWVWRTVRDSTPTSRIVSAYLLAALRGRSDPTARLGKFSRRTLVLFGLLDWGIVVDRILRHGYPFFTFRTQILLEATLLLVWASFIVSGWGLVRARRWGLILNYAQFPFRLSLGFLSFAWLAELILPQLPTITQNELMWGIAVVLEGIRLGISIMIHRDWLTTASVSALPPS